MARGSIRKRGDTWQLRVYVGRDPITGRKQYASRSVRGSRRAAEATLTELQAEANRGQIAGGDTYLAHLLERWLRTSSPDWAPRTADANRDAVERHIVPALGARKLRELTTAHVEAFYGHLADEKGLSASSVRRVHAALRRALGTAVRWGWIHHNPADEAKKPALHPPDIRPPSIAEVRRLIDAAAATSLDHHAFLQLAATTGARRSELCALRWSDIDLEVGDLVISRALDTADRGRTEKDTKTHQSRRLALDATTRRTLRGHRARLLERALAGGVAFEAPGYVFPADLDGARPISPDATSRRFARLRDRIHLDGRYRLQDLRHFVATQMLARGYDVRTVAARLGHADPAITLRRYTHFIPARDREAADSLGQALDDEESGG